MWCYTELEPGEALPVRYDVQHHRPSMRDALDDDWECTDQVACAYRIRQNELDSEDPPVPRPERLTITATDARGDPLL